MNLFTNHTPFSTLLCLVFSFLLYSPSLQGQCQLSCHGNLNLSLSQDCEATMTPAKVLSSTPNCTGPLIVQVLDELDMEIPTSPIITSEYIGRTVKVMVTDEASGISCWSNVFVEDKTPPFFTSCVNDTISCTDTIPMATAMDACGSVELTFTESVDQLNCNTGDYTFFIQRFYTATDEQGMTATCIQQIHIEKPDPADIMFPPDFDGFDQDVLDCSINPSADPAFTGSPTINGVPIASACMLFAFSRDDTTRVCEGTTKIFRRWRVASWCGDGIVAEGRQFIKIADTTGPSIICPDSLTQSADSDVCSATVTLPPATATDDCSSPDNITITVAWEFGTDFGPVGGVPLGTHIVTYTATDDCGNTSTCATTITIVDETIPAVTCESQKTVGLNNTSTEFCAAFFDDGSTDNCTMPLDSFCVRRVGDPLFTDCVVFTCDDVNQPPIMVELKVCDEFGNCNFCTINVIVEDTRPPAIIRCPSNVTLPCTAYPADTTLTGVPEAQDACGIAAISFTDIESIDSCSAGTVTRRFTITGTDGLTSTCTQIITFDEGDPPIYTFPPDTTVQCLEDATTDNTGFPTATDDCSNIFFIGFEDEVIPSTDNCKIKIIRRFTIANNCNDSLTTGGQIIEVLDITPPVFDSTINSADFVCADDITPSMPVATDNCMDEITITLQDTTITRGNCPDNFTITEIYVAVDRCGNESDPFIFTITVNDTVPPTADPLPQLGPFACVEDIPSPDEVVFTNLIDNCGNDVEIDTVTTEIPMACLDTINRTFVLIDQCGNTTDLVQSIIIQDIVPPTAPALAALGPYACAGDIPPADTTIVIDERDNCGGNVTVTFEGETMVGNNCINARIRTYRLTDMCGNTADLTQNIMVNDSIPPTADTPAPLGPFECVTDIPAGLPSDLTNVMDNCGGDVTVTVDDSRFGTPMCMTNFNRIFILTDRCNNTSTLTQQIIIDDKTPPTWTWNNMPSSLDISADCAEEVMLVPPTAMARCNDATVSVRSDVVSNMTCDHRFERTITYEATDSCGNVSEPFTVMVTVFDSIPPMGQLTSNAGPFNCIADFLPNTGNVTRITDNCEGVVTVTHLNDTAPPMCMGDVIRTYQLTDICGNTRLLTQTIEIRDTIAPTADALPTLGPYTCADLVPAADSSLVMNAIDNCGGSVIISILPDEMAVRCFGSYLRTYQLSDLCGNTSLLTQTIMINDNVAPRPINTDTLGPYECEAAFPDSVFLLPGIDNCGDTVTSVLQINLEDLPSSCDTVITQMFVLTDACGNDTLVSRFIIIKDTIPPTFFQPFGALDTMVACAFPEDQLPIPTIQDRCQFAEAILVANDTTNITCPNQFTQRLGYVARDFCNNENPDTFFVNIVVNDTIPPMITFCPSDTSANDFDPFPQPPSCGEPFTFTVEGADNCDSIHFSSRIVEMDGFEVMIDGPLIDRNFNIGVNVVTYFAEDACGNIDSCSFEVEVFDITSPAYSCVGSPLCIPINPGDTLLFFPDQFVRAKDDCSATEPATFEGSSPDTLIFTYDLLNGMGQRDTTISIFLSDIHGNQSPAPCDVDVVIFDGPCPSPMMATISGGLHNEMGMGVEGVSIEIESPLASQIVETEEDGQYVLPDLMMNEDYHIVPYHDHDVLNGVTTMDLIMLGQHLLGLSELQSSYQLIAADVNNDGIISSRDLIALRRAILLLDEHFQNNTSWRFVDTEFNFPVPDNPFITPFPESRFVHELEANMNNVDFMAVKVGDLNLNATSNGLLSGDTRSEGTLSFFVKDQLLESGEEITVDFMTQSNKGLRGFQFTIDYNPSVLEMIPDEIYSETLDLEASNFGFTQIDNGKLTVSWFNNQPVQMTDPSKAFTLRFRAKTNLRLSEVLTVNDVLVPAEAYDASYTTLGVQLTYKDSIQEQPANFALLQNRPNPFRQQTVIPFVLSEAGDATITITDINGRIIAEHSAYYEVGYQEFVLEKANLNVSGILIYHLKSGGFEATRKMIVEVE